MMRSYERPPEIKYNRLYTPDEVCRILEISKATLKRWKNSGVIVPECTKPRPKYKGGEILRCWACHWRLELDFLHRRKDAERQEQEALNKRMSDAIKQANEEYKHKTDNLIKQQKQFNNKGCN